MMRSFCTSCWMSSAFAHKGIDEGGANGHTSAFQSSYVNDYKVRVSSIQVVEFAKTRERGIAVNVLENEFTGMLAADARDVYFYLGHVESQFRVFPKPLANLDEHLQGSFESGSRFPNFDFRITNLDSVNFCTSKAISMELWHFPSVREVWLTESRFVM
jgi:hypothetical protein